MTVQLNGYNLNVSNILPSADAVVTEWDAWENSAYKRKVRIIGRIVKVTIHGWEKDVAWNDSAVKNFMLLAGTDSAVNFNSDLALYVEAGTNVKVLSVECLPGGMPSKRNYVVTIQYV